MIVLSYSGLLEGWNSRPSFSFWNKTTDTVTYDILMTYLRHARDILLTLTFNILGYLCILNVDRTSVVVYWDWLTSPCSECLDVSLEKNLHERDDHAEDEPDVNHFDVGCLRKVVEDSDVPEGVKTKFLIEYFNLCFNHGSSYTPLQKLELDFFTPSFSPCTKLRLCWGGYMKPSLTWSSEPASRLAGNRKENH